ncbi:MAG: hypothetical protein ABIS51_14470 [Sphingomonas sp.]
MQLSSALVPLFDYSIAALLKDLPAQDSPDWDKHQHRQQAFSQQRATRSIVLRWLSNDWQPRRAPIVLQSAEVPFRRYDCQAVPCRASGRRRDPAAP